ncbi:protein of unknown function [Burkholderia multivorans]
MNVSSSFKPDAKTTEIMEPRVSPFDDPTEFSEATAMFGAAPGDDRPDAALAKSAAMRIGIVATVGIDDLGLAKRSAACLSRQIFAGLVNIGKIYDESRSNCEQFVGLVKVEGI